MELWQQVDNSTAVDLARSNMANAAKAEGNFPLARALLEQVAAACSCATTSAVWRRRSTGSATSPPARGELAAARRYHHQSLEKFSQVERSVGPGAGAVDLAQINIDALEHEAASGSAQECAAGVPRARPSARHRRQLESLALCAGNQARDDEAVTLASAAAAIRIRIGMPHEPAERERFDQALELARSRLSKDDYDTAWDAGRSVSLDRILGMGVAAGPRTQA